MIKKSIYEKELFTQKIWQFQIELLLLSLDSLNILMK